MTYFSSQALTRGLQAVADFTTQSGNPPGTLVSVTDGLRTAAIASGQSDLENGISAQPDQSIQIGSQTKMMTAVVVLELAEEGVIDLDQPFASYLDPALIEGVANADTATVRQALQMKTGIPNYTAVVAADGSTMMDRLAENPDAVHGGDQILALLDGVAPTGTVGQQYEYSNTNYFYLSKLIEAVTGKSLAEVFDERIFSPLGMEDTYLNDFRDNPDRVASYLNINGEMVDVTEVPLDAHGEGGVISTTADMTTFLQALLVDETATTPGVLATMTNFDSASLDPRGFDFNYGLSQFEFAGAGTFIGFAGGILGTDSATYLHLDSGRIISTMVNQLNSDFSGTGTVIGVALELSGDEVWQELQQDAPITIEGISAADLEIVTEGGVSSLVAGDARLDLGDKIQTYDSGDFIFADGSGLLLGTRQGDVLTVAADASADHQLRGFAGRDQLTGGSGDDLLDGGWGADLLVGAGGADQLIGSRGGDTLRGGAGQDRLLGGKGVDQLLGDAGSDVLKGQKGRDMLFGGDGNDRLLGGAGQDQLSGGTGSDVMAGGRGADVFVFHHGADDGWVDHDIITDFQTGADLIDLGGRDIDSHRQDDTGLTLVLAGDGDTIQVQGISELSEIAFL